MRQADVRQQFEAAISNVEAALQDLSERLEDLPGRRRGAIRRAGKTLRRSTANMSNRVPIQRASSLAADTGRTVRQHPLTTAMAAAVAGYCIWSLIRLADQRSAQSPDAHAGGKRRFQRLRNQPAWSEPEGEARH